MDIIYSMLTGALIFSTPIIITALGGLFSERSGIVNIGLEGLMMVGGFFGATVTFFFEGVSPSIAPWLGIIIGALAGGVFSLILAYLSINLKADQVIAGTAVNILATGVTIYLAQIIFNQERTNSFDIGFLPKTYPIISKIPIIGDIFFTSIYSTVFIGFILVAVVTFVIYKTRFGLRLRACGEHPHAADSMGINVYKMRYLGVILSGVFAGLGGAILVLTQDTQFSITSIHGVGFISLAALIFGKWNPIGVLGAAFFFGFSQIIGTYAPSIAFLSELPNEVFYILPYIITIIALVIFSGKNVGPKAAGQVYDKGLR